MSLFGSIMSRIFGGSAAAAPATPGAVPGATPGETASTAFPGTATAAGLDPSGAAAGAPQPTVDVAAVLEEMAGKHTEKLNWRTSIVDLMKLLDLDSSITARRELAQELKFSGDMGDSAAMNIWLHKQVMRKLAENGGKVPADLRD